MFTRDSIKSVDLSTRAKRRNVVAIATDLLVRVKTAEEAYMLRIPENLQSGDAYNDAEDAIEVIGDAIDSLSDAY